MWIDILSDGCVYDTIDCYHDCEYGKLICDKCGEWIWYGKKPCDCKKRRLVCVWF